MEQKQLSPHDETILFRLVEFESSLPREQQSRRFEVDIIRSPGQVPRALIRGATALDAFLDLRTDAGCFSELRAAGYISGGNVRTSHPLTSNVTTSRLDTVRLLDYAFKYYDEKHDFPTVLAEERRQLVDSKASTFYPEVVAHLKKAYNAIWVEQPEDNWSGVPHDCQDALRSFADNVYKPEYASMLQEKEPSSADFEEQLEQTIRANTGGKELRGLLVNFNKYLNARRHDTGTSRDEAKRCVLFTYLLVAEICELPDLAKAT